MIFGEATREFGEPTISRGSWRQAFIDYRSPWLEQADELYDLIEEWGRDPNFWLGIGIREHGLGSNRESVLHRQRTNSWTNARSVRAQGLEPYRMVTDPHRDGQYVAYASVRDSLIDGMYRLTDPDYVYAQQDADTLGEIINLWTESDPAGYIASMIRTMTHYADRIPHTHDYAPIFGDIVDLRPHLPTRDDSRPRGPRLQLPLDTKLGMVVHYRGVDTPAKTNPNWQSFVQDANYHLDRTFDDEGTVYGDGIMYHLGIPGDGTLYLLRDLRDVLWHCGVTEHNRHALAVQVNIGPDQEPTEDQVNTLRRVADGWRKFSSTPANQIWGHQELSATPCPDRLMERFVLPYRAQALSQPETITFAEVPYKVVGPFAQHYTRFGGFHAYGFPRSPQLHETCPDGVGRTVQYFDNTVLEHHPNNAGTDWEVLARNLGLAAWTQRSKVA